MNYLIYISAAARLMGDGELLEILQASRKNNKANNITGMLIYGDGTFIQVIEGEENELDNLYAKLLLDSRHKNLITVLKGKLEKRNFADWSMGFKTMNDNAAEPIDGFFQLDDDFLCRDASGLLKYFHSFYQINQVDGGGRVILIA